MAQWFFLPSPPRVRVCIQFLKKENHQHRKQKLAEHDGIIQNASYIMEIEAPYQEITERVGNLF